VETTPAATAKPEYLTVAEVSRLFRVSMPTVYRRVADGQLPAVRIGATIRIPLATLEHLENSAEHTPGLERRAHHGEAEQEANPEGRFTKGP
jgi:excisionase family DNA binding protein